MRGAIALRRLKLDEVGPKLDALLASAEGADKRALGNSIAIEPRPVVFTDILASALDMGKRGNRPVLVDKV